MRNPDTSVGEMIKKPFFDWVIEQRDRHGWNDAELSTKAEISHSNLSLIMSGQRNITFDFCVGLAKAFRVRPEFVLYRAGLLTKPAIAKDELTEDEAELIQAYRALPVSHRQTAIDIVRGLADRLERRRKDR